jgi:hypothetical protein
MRQLATASSNVFSFPDLQIITDEQFLSARAKLTGNRATYRLSRSRDGEKKLRPVLLARFLKCTTCKTDLVVGGAHGRYFFCKSCKNLPVEQQNLFSEAPRRLATEMIITAICDKVLAVPGFVDSCVDRCVAEIDKLQQRDPSRLNHLQRQRKKSKDQLDLVIQNFTGEDVALVKDQLTRLRSELSRLDSEIASERRLVDQDTQMPTTNEIRETICRLSTILMSAIEDEESDEFDLARELIRLLTGGHIEMVQQGEKTAQRGWLQARMKINLAAVALRDCPGGIETSSEIELVVDIQRPKTLDPAIAEARILYDQDLFEHEIAQRMGRSRANVQQLLQKSFDAEGVPKPDGYERRKRIEKARGLHHYQLISDEVFELAESGVLLCEIAERLKTNRDVITESLRYAYEKRDLHLLDGRARRKSLDHKSR